MSKTSPQSSKESSLTKPVFSRLLGLARAAAVPVGAAILAVIAVKILK